MPRALWLPERLREGGVAVKESNGWRERGSSEFYPKLVIAHHTADGAGEAPSLNLCINGRSDLPGPLCQILLGRSGTAYLVASGRANHAGSGSWKQVTGNTNAFGIEAENTGRGEPWNNAQIEAYIRIVVVLLKAIGRNQEWVCGHKEWTTRKIDPNGIDMNWFRAEVGRRLMSAPPPAPPPHQPPPPPPADPWDADFVPVLIASNEH